MNYHEWIDKKSQLDGDFGFEPIWIPSFLKDFQSHLVEWEIRKGRSAMFADCGLGKSPMSLVWSQNVYLHTKKPVLILTPLSVAIQFEHEANKFGIDAVRSYKDEITAPIVITNYERLHYFNPNDFGGVYCDESSILKSFDGTRRKEITQFMRKVKYRLLGTATAAPNDYTEVGTSSEALGYLGARDMLSKFFTNKPYSARYGRDKDLFVMARSQWRFKGHAEEKFWRWMTSWARALRKPSDLGFDDAEFILPDLFVKQHTVEATTVAPGMLLNLPAIGWKEQRAERQRTIQERCEMAAELVNHTGQPATVWCSLNPEGDLLDKLIPDAEQVSGRDDDDSKEAKFDAFSRGDLRVLITKPKIGAWGLNWQHCNHAVYFPTHSYEQRYQLIRRHWRFGQTRPVKIDTVSTIGELMILKNLERKEEQAVKMFESLVKHMNDSMKVERRHTYDKQVEIPKWLM